MTPEQLQGKRILIVGAGLTGLSVVRYLQRQGLAFTLANDKVLSADAEQSLAGSAVLTGFDADQFIEFDVAILSPGIPRRQPAVAAAIAAGVDVIGDIELFAGQVESAVIAVTGSNGKSTVVAWLAHVLNACDVQCVACGNIGLPALDALTELADVYVVELSSYQLESTRTLESLSAVVLNVSDDHMDRYDSLEDYAATKRRIHAGARHCVANRDDRRTWPAEQSASEQEPAGTRWFTLDASSSDDYSPVERDGETWLQSGGTTLVKQSELHMPGNHNMSNALAILALLEPLGLPRERSLDALVSFRGLPHRTELVAVHRGVRWYNDSKGTNVDACAKAISAMPGPVILIAGGQGKGADFHALRSLVARCVKVLLLLGEDAQRLEDALGGCAPVERVADLDAAVMRAEALAEPDDVVLLSPACASFDMFASFVERGERFCTAVSSMMAAGISQPAQGQAGEGLA